MSSIVRGNANTAAKTCRVAITSAKYVLPLIHLLPTLHAVAAFAPKIRDWDTRVVVVEAHVSLLPYGGAASRTCRGCGGFRFTITPCLVQTPLPLTRLPHPSWLHQTPLPFVGICFRRLLAVSSPCPLFLALSVGTHASSVDTPPCWRNVGWAMP